MDSAASTRVRLWKLQQLLSMAAVAGSLVFFLGLGAQAEAAAHDSHHSVVGGGYKTVTLTVYSYNTITGPNPTAVKVAPYNSTQNWTTVFVADDQVTRTSDRSGAALGWLRTIGADTDITNNAAFTSLFLTFYLDYSEHGVTGTVVTVGTAPTFGGDYVIVGGTGAFVLARGVLTLVSNTRDTTQADIIAFNKVWAFTFYLSPGSPLLPKLRAIQHATA